MRSVIAIHRDFALRLAVAHVAFMAMAITYLYSSIVRVFCVLKGASQATHCVSLAQSAIFGSSSAYCAVVSMNKVGSFTLTM